MGKLVRLKGLSTKEEIASARESKRPLFLGIPLATNNGRKLCQLDCRYCFVEPRTQIGRTLTLEEHFRIMSQFAQMGGKYVKTAHVGEPLLDPSFLPLIDHAMSLGLYWTSFSNLVGMTPELAPSLYAKRVSLIGKLNSLNPDVQEWLTGRTGYFRKENWTEHNGVLIPLGLKHLIDAGFNRPMDEGGVEHTRLGVDIIVTRINYQDIPAVVEFCLENNIYPDIEKLELTGQVRTRVTALQVSREEEKWLYERLVSILGKEFLEERRALTTDFCPLFQVGIVYDPDGSVRYCYVVPMEYSLNLKENSVAYAYSQLLTFKESRRRMVMASITLETASLLGFDIGEEVLTPCPNGIFKPL